MAVALLAALALPFLAAGAALLAGGALRLRTGWLVAAGAAASFALLLRLALQLDPVAPWAVRLPWLPAVDAAFALRADGFGLFFALLVTGVGVLVALYSLAYLEAEDAGRARRYYGSLAVFMGAMVGIALADDLLLLFVFWELTSVSSFLLIGHYFEDEAAKRGAVTALQITALGGLVMLVGFLLVGQVAGTFAISALADPVRAATVLDSPLGVWALLFILCGAFTKSAQVPFHFWLPGAMVAPTPISAYLHAATMVKAGVFLVGRLLPVFGDSPLWMPVLVGVGGASMLLGAYQATREHDLKAILARTTGSVLGMLFLLYGLRAAEQDALQMLSHALYKGALFLIAGIVEHRAHTRDLRALGGLRHALPLPFLACALAALSMAGIPPLFGFAAKESIYAVLLQGGDRPFAEPLRWLLLAAVVTASALFAATAYRVTAGIFFGAVPGEPAPARDAHRQRGWLWLSPLVLAAGCLIAGLATASAVAPAIARTFSSSPSGALELSPLPHFNAAMLATLATWALAALLYHARARLTRLGDRAIGVPSAAVVWQRVLAAVASLGEAFSRRWANGSLHWYLAGTAVTLPLLTLYAFRAVGLSPRAVGLGFDDLPWYGALASALLAGSALAAVMAASRLAMALAATATGFLVALVYVVYRSPDIVLTQILIETASTIFLLLVMVHLPPFQRERRPGARLMRAAVAGSVGLAAALLLLLAMTPGLRATDNIATQPGGLLSQALALGGGANAVNVIIVDIRALDTSGEVTVLMVVGLCVYGLLRTRRGWK